MLKKSFVKQIKNKLEQDKQDLLKKSTITSIRNDVDSDGDETDEIQANVLIEFQHQLLARNQSKLLQISDALKRIADDIYGICQDCEEEIPEKRLLHNPYFVTCVDCAEDRETENKRGKY